MPDNLSDKPSLTPAEARILVVTQPSFISSSITELTTEVAEVLAQHRGFMFLNQLLEVTPQAAQALGMHGGSLCLRQLRLKTPDVAQALTKNARGLSLTLSCGDGLPVEVAKALSAYRGGLNLHNAHTLSDESALALSEHEGRLCLRLQNTLPPSLAGAVACHRGDLALDDVTTLTQEVAKAIAAHVGSLSMKRLASLYAGVGRELASHKGGLDLSGLNALSEDDAEALSEHEGSLRLDGLTYLAYRSAYHLSKHRGPLHLNRVKRITSQTAEALSSLSHDLQLNGLTVITGAIAKHLAEHTATLSLNAARRLSGVAARHLANHKGGKLHLDRLEALSPAAAAALLGYRGVVTTDSLNTSMNPTGANQSGTGSKPVEPGSDGAGSTTDSLGNAIKELEQLIGLQGVKKEVNSLIQFLRAQQLRTRKGLKAAAISRHMVFSGNPGTGKTTVARIVGAIYKAAGFLTGGHTIETDRSSLVAEFIGQTAPKTLEVCWSALGGVLFIDEAYSLAPPDHYGNDFGKEAIDTLLKFMEDNRDDLVVIVAGYPKKMDAFLNSNPGLQSRFNKTVSFENYTPEELVKILRKMCEEGDYVLSRRAELAASYVFTQQCSQATETFGNARFARNIYEQALIEHGRRIGDLDDPTKEQLQTLEAEDFQL
jgi:Holliday junction resolvasome RuvABC ATP-dependent DNA helicase subunit